MKKKVELLAPAGSFDIMKACFNAGADAVYMGLSKFSARAYADNADASSYEDAIRYAHKFGKKLYLTFNTLFKYNELSEIKDLIEPLYEAGLDAIIVQDIGVMLYLRKEFPELPIHASTQTTILGPFGASFFKEIGCSRVVPARELNLREIRSIYDTTGMEIECFIHGALCYGYSGECFFSSMIGGRSGNRGRCAQACRMPYTLKNGDGRYLSKREEDYLLSLKDLNTLAILPKIIEAGVCSLKIEGRMKKTEYAAGVTSIYRKYLDLYLSGRPYQVDPNDERRLFDLFNRQGFTKGYYEQHNGKDMLTLKESEFREHDDEWIDEIRRNYIQKKGVQKIHGSYEIKTSEPMKMTVSTVLEDRKIEVEYYSENVPDLAKNRSTTIEEVEKQLRKTGDSGFEFESLTGNLDEGLFLPVSILNEFRRSALQELEKEIAESYQRTSQAESDHQVRNFETYLTNSFSMFSERPNVDLFDHDSSLRNTSAQVSDLSVLVRNEEQLLECLRCDSVRRVILDSVFADHDNLHTFCERIHHHGKSAFYAFPYIFNDRARNYFDRMKDAFRQVPFDGYLIRSLETLGFIRSIESMDHQKVLQSDFTIYAFNPISRDYLKKYFNMITIPQELSGREIFETGFQNAEMMVYGRQPMMFSANCLYKTTGNCLKEAAAKKSNAKIPSDIHLIDRMTNSLPVLNDCMNCTNTIFNAVPLNLSGDLHEIREFGVSSLRLEFSFETREECSKVLKDYEKAIRDQISVKPEGAFTRGRFLKGVE